MLRNDVNLQRGGDQCRPVVILNTMELDFSKMKWAIHAVPVDKDVLTFIPELRYMFAEHLNKIHDAGLNPNIIIRYIIYIYHEHSPFVFKIDDILMRKKMAMQKAGAEITEEIQAVINNEVDAVCHAAIQFAKFENNIRRMALMLQTEAYYYWNMELVKGSSKVDVKKLRELRQEIDTLTLQLFKGDTEITNFVGSAKVLEDRAIFPEDVVANRKTKNQTAAGVATESDSPQGR